jgi:ribonuclease D
MFETDPARLISNPTDLRALLDRLSEAPRFAIDTEFVSEDTYRPELCLIQLATDEGLALIDPLAVGPKPLRRLWQITCDPASEVIVHAGAEDLRIIWLAHGELPSRVVDVQVAAGLIGNVYPISLSNLVERTLGVRPYGGETRTDWRKRPLSEAQIRYALDDVRYLLPVVDSLHAELAARGRRDWAEFEYARLLEIVRNRDDEERWRRIAGIHQLSRRGLEVARRLAEWRESVAQSTNRPIRFVLRDDILVAIAKRQPTTRRDLEALRDLQRPHLLSHAEEFLACVRQALDVPDDGLPHHPKRHDEKPGSALIVNLLTAALGDACARGQVAASLVANASDLRELVRWVAAGEPEGEPPALLQNWRAEVCGPTLLNLLSGRTSLRITDLESENPVSLESAEPNPPRTREH